MPVEYAVVVVRLVQIQYTCVLEEKTRQNSARIFARVGHGEKGEGDEVWGSSVWTKFNFKWMTRVSSIVIAEPLQYPHRSCTLHDLPNLLAKMLGLMFII